MSINNECSAAAPSMAAPLEGVAVDWLTVVCSEDSIRDRARYRVQLWQLEEARNGNTVSPWSLAGHYGNQCGGIAYGDGRASTVVQVSGAAGRRLWRAVMALGGRPSRLDLQATVTVDVGDTNPALQAYRAGAEGKRVGRQTSAKTLIQGSDGGFTCYLGSPSSEIRMRVYDKGVESKTAPAGRLWRWELQARRQVARAIMDKLQRAPIEADFIQSAIASHCLKLGVDFPLKLIDTVSYDTGRTLSDAATSREWLRESVAPCVGRLLQFYSLNDILDTLGLLTKVKSPYRDHLE